MWFTYYVLCLTFTIYTVLVMHQVTYPLLLCVSLFGQQNLSQQQGVCEDIEGEEPTKRLAQESRPLTSDVTQMECLSKNNHIKYLHSLPVHTIRLWNFLVVVII